MDNETIKVTQEMLLVLQKLDYIIYLLREQFAEEETKDEEILTALEGLPERTRSQGVADGEPEH